MGPLIHFFFQFLNFFFFLQWVTRDMHMRSYFKLEASHEFNTYWIGGTSWLTSKYLDFLFAGINLIRDKL